MCETLLFNYTKMLIGACITGLFPARVWLCETNQRSKPLATEDEPRLSLVPRRTGNETMPFSQGACPLLWARENKPVRDIGCS